MRVLIVPNAANPRAVEAARDLAPWLEESGARPALVADDADATGLDRFAVNPTDVGEPALAVALGGDGTILKTVHILGPVGTPVLGVNLGRRGFLSGTKADGMREAVTAALAGEARVELRATLEARVSIGGREAGRYIALNEVYVGRGPSGRATEIDVAVNGKHLARYMCDGVVVASPTGSTAYALSAGGPILAPDVSGLVVVPVAPHALAARPLVIGPSDAVEVTLRKSAGEACVTVDGDVMPCRLPLEKVEVWRGEHDVKLVKLGGRDFYDVLRAEFLGG